MYMDDYKRWLAADLEDPALTEELKKIEGDEEQIKVGEDQGLQT